MHSVTVIGFLLCCLIHLAGIIVFLIGFFPLKPAVHDIASISDGCFMLKDECCRDNVTADLTSDCVLQPVYGRVVIIVIDALRTDFVLPDVGHDGQFSVCHEPKMSSVCHRIVDQQTASFHAVTHPPTVTLPRIKVIHHYCLKNTSGLNVNGINTFRVGIITVNLLVVIEH